ncbi:hypothetical protein ACSQ67_001718 [Phaseolus vulgaris]
MEDVVGLLGRVEEKGNEWLVNEVCPGNLSKEKIPQISLELVMEKEFELSHSSKNAGVHLCGYKAYYSGDDSEEHEFIDSDEDIPLVVEPEKYNRRKSVVGLLEEWRRKGMNGKKNGMIRAFFPANTSDFFYSSNPTSTRFFQLFFEWSFGVPRLRLGSLLR